MGKKLVIILVVFGLLLTGCAGKNSGIGSNAGVNTDLPGALNLVLGSTDKPSVFSSYHMELTLDTPQLNDDSTAVVNGTTQISADVAGTNIHIVQVDPGATDSKEGFIIGDTEYKLVNGEKQDTMGFIALSWAMWPLQVTIPYAYASNWAKKTGSESIDGRIADIYTFDSADSSVASQAVMASAGLSGMTNAKGTVWIDQETGAMLKLQMTYTESLSNSDGKQIGSGTGNVALEITKVNQTQVVEP
jgi:hypothetical protein